MGIAEVFFLQFVWFCIFHLLLTCRYRTSYTDTYGGSAYGGSVSRS